MKTALGLWVIATALSAGSAAAQEDGSANPPVQNINAGYNPTAPALQPPAAAHDDTAPTYPAATDKPAARGGTIGDDPSKRRDMPDRAGYRKRQLERERALPEPNFGTHTATPPGQEASPGAPEEENPGAVRGGPQP